MTTLHRVDDPLVEKPNKVASTPGLIIGMTWVFGHWAAQDLIEPETKTGLVIILGVSLVLMWAVFNVCATHIPATCPKERK